MSKLQKGGSSINIIIVAGVLGLLAVVFLLFSSTQTAAGAAQEFMEALATKDVDRLTELSYLENPDPPLRDQWDFCVNRGAKNFVFLWQFMGTERVSDDEQVVKIVLLVFRDFQGREGDVINVPLRRIDGEWKVVLGGLDRTFFPYLPS
jgi:hypothetical protein